MIRRSTFRKCSALLFCGALLLSACTGEETPNGRMVDAGKEQTAPASPVPPPSPAPANPAPVTPASPTAPMPPPAPPTDADARQPGNLAPCPGINIRRPPGSNCLGIVPSACSADRLGAFVGRGDSPAVRRELAAMAGHDNIRWIRPGEPVIENLDPGRLNVALDAAGRIAGVDCY